MQNAKNENILLKSMGMISLIVYHLIRKDTMTVKCLTVGPFQMNSYVVFDEERRHCLLFDPGDEPERIIEFLETEHLRPGAIFNTHAHIDHVRFLEHVQRHYEIPFYLAPEERPLLDNLASQGVLFGLETGEQPRVDYDLKEGQHFQLGTLAFHTLHTPGHSPGSICFVFNDFVIGGDVLFYDSIGRTDLYMGSMALLLESIRAKLWPLPDETIVYPGHGPATTIGREKRHNPFLS
ncbi:MAG: MBL fold metallo-hydrolase [Calditrichaeota bacterium]|nr:MAG: MBL fold metallo-hydrolase [Calditrichota bacterium]